MYYWKVMKTLMNHSAVQAALKAGVGVFPLSPYCLESNRKGLLLGFAHLNSDDIVEGIDRLARVLV